MAEKGSYLVRLEQSERAVSGGRNLLYSILILCSDEPAHGWAALVAEARSLKNLNMVSYSQVQLDAVAVRSGRSVTSGSPGDSDAAGASRAARGPNFTRDSVGGFDIRQTDAQRAEAAERAKPPRMKRGADAIAPQGFVWPDGSAITDSQLVAITLTDAAAKAPHFGPFVRSAMAKYDTVEVEDLARIPLAFAQRNPMLLAQVEAAQQTASARASAKADTSPSSFDAVAAFMARLGSSPADLVQTKAGYGRVGPLDPESSCSKAILETVAKLARDHQTMVLRPRGNDLNYFKDQYRALFFAKNLAPMNAEPDPDFEEFRVTDSKGTKRKWAVGIVPNASCTAAYVRMLHFGSTTGMKKFYALSSARIDAAFLKTPNQGRVSQQYYIEEGFTNARGRPADFSYTCDDDLCRVRR